MKIGFLGNSEGNLALIEQALVQMVEIQKVDRIVPLGDSVADAARYLAQRRQTFPEEVSWTEPDYSDFVMAAVLAETPDVEQREVDRTRAFSAVLRATSAKEQLSIGGRSLIVRGVHRRRGTEALMVQAAPGRPGIDRSGRVVRLCPGHMAERRRAGVPASFAVVSDQDGRLVARFYRPDGKRLGDAEALETKAE